MEGERREVNEMGFPSCQKPKQRENLSTLLNIFTIGKTQFWKK